MAASATSGAATPLLAVEGNMPGPLDGSDSESESHAAGTRSAAARSDAANAATNHLTHLAMYMDAPNHGRWTPALVVRAMYDGGWGWLLRVSTIDIPAGWPWVIRTLLWLLPWLSFGYWITVDIITLVAVDLPPPVYLTDGMMAAQVTWYAVGDPLFVVAVRRLLQSAEMAMTFDIAFPLAKQPPGGPGRDSESVHGRGDVETPDGSGRESDSDLETNAHAVTWPTPRAAPGASGPGARPRREISLARRGTRRGSTGAGVGFLAPSTWWRRALAATSLDSSPPPTALGTQPPSWDTVGVLVPAPHASSAPSAAAYGYGAAVTFWRWARLSLLLVAMGPMFNMIVSTYISAVDALDVPARPVQFKFFHSDEYQTIWGINKVNTWFTALVATIAYGLMFVLGLLLMRGARHIRDAIKRDDVEFTALSRQRGTSASARAVALVRAQSHVVTAAWQRHAGVLEAVASRLNVALGIIITSISVNAVYNLGWSIALILLHEHPELLAIAPAFLAQVVGQITIMVLKLAGSLLASESSDSIARALRSSARLHAHIGVGLRRAATKPHTAGGHSQDNTASAELLRAADAHVLTYPGAIAATGSRAHWKVFGIKINRVSARRFIAASVSTISLLFVRMNVLQS